jgi:hypothetical protein
MGCNCKKNVRQAPQVIMSQPTPQEEDWYNNIDIIEPIPQTPDELHRQEMNKWNGGQIKIEQDKMNKWNSVQINIEEPKQEN